MHMVDTADAAADGWFIATPDEQDMDGAVLDGLAAQFNDWPEAKLHAVVMARGGKLVYERYFTGEDQAWGKPLGEVAYHAGLKHDLRSVSKSVVSLLFGIALDRGFVGDLDTPVFSFFPGCADLRTPEKDKITLRHLLTMSAGLGWNEELPYSDRRNSERQMTDAPDRVRFVLEQPLRRPPGATYAYNGGLTALLARILELRTGEPLDVLAQNLLFTPLGIDDVEWARYGDGAPVAASGLRMRPRDLAKIGQLVLDHGIAGGNHVVSRAWMDQAVDAQVNGEGLYFYGYHWWLGRSLVARREIRWIAGVGWGGQRLFIVPELDLVVAVLAGLYADPPLARIVGEVVLRRYALTAALPVR
jgi:CubicO group peptidase (beta-lactamase class C family)